MIWLLLLLPVLLVVPYLNSILMRPGAIYSDLLISHIPNALYINHSINQWGQIPLWSDSILSGYPFYANPLSGLWYLPNWISVIFPDAAGFNLLLIIHLLWGGLGMVFWLRSEGLKLTSAVTAAILFESMPKLWIHFAAGHVSLIYAICWTPWLVYAQSKASVNGSHRMWRYSPGLILGVILLADPRWSIYATPLWLIYSVRKDAPWYKLQHDQNGIFRFWKWDFHSILRLFINLFIAVMIAAPLLFPLLQYSQLSTRGQLTVEEATEFSLPYSNLLQMLIAPVGGNVESAFYPTMFGLACLVLGLSSNRMRRATGFWLILAGLSIFISLGSNVPFLKELSLFPILNLVRVPSRALFLFSFLTCAICGFVIDALSGTTPAEYRIGRLKPNILLIFVMEIAILFNGFIAWTSENSRIIGISGMVWAVACFLMIFLRINNRISVKNLTIFCIGAACLEPAVVNRINFEPNDLLDLSSEAQQAAQYLQGQSGLFRTYSPSYSLSQQVSASYDYQMADGVDPMQIESYRDYMILATGVPMNGYSVTLPAFEYGDPLNDNQVYLPNSQMLGWLNVRYILANFPVNEPELVLSARFGNTRIYENQSEYPRAWVQNNNNQISDEIIPVEDVTWTPNQIVITAEGPGELVLSEVNYPGWEVRVNGQVSKISTVGKIFRAVEIPAGIHKVVFSFSPIDLKIGGGCALITVIIWLFAWLFENHRKKLAVEIA